MAVPAMSTRLGLVLYSDLGSQLQNPSEPSSIPVNSIRHIKVVDFLKVTIYANL